MAAESLQQLKLPRQYLVSCMVRSLGFEGLLCMQKYPVVVFDCRDDNLFAAVHRFLRDGPYDPERQWSPGKYDLRLAPNKVPLV